MPAFGWKMHSVRRRWSLIRSILISWLFWIDLGDSESFRDVYTKECEGSNSGLTHSSSTSEERYESYRANYENCTLVRKNLEIKFIELTDEKYDFSFLENIREVGGYVLIYGNFVRRIRLTRLRVIRGMMLYNTTENDQIGLYSLYVSKNSRPDNNSIGLQELQMPSLVEIPKGKVLFKGNSRLCFGEKTIDWDHILLNNEEKSVVFLNEPGYEKINCQSVGACHENCTAAVEGRRYCWGREENTCQQFRKCGNCVQNKKCDSQCIAGCDDPEQPAKCLSCQNFARLSDTPGCIRNCSEEIRTQTSSGAKFIQPTDKYAQGSKCVKKCEDGFVAQDYDCVEFCKDGYMVQENTTHCVPCQGKCKETCKGTEGLWMVKRELPRFHKCKKVEGHLKIYGGSIFGHPLINNETMSVEDLELLSSIEEITGSLEISGLQHPDFTSLDFLRNLRTINGAGTDDDEMCPLTVSMTSLKSLDLKSLQRVEKCIAVHDNADLCFAKGINWTTMTNGDLWVYGNRKSSHCDAEGFVCSAMCLPSNGCLGPDDDSCITCRDFRLMDGRCSDNCSTENGFYVDEQGIRGNRQCRPCDEQCNGNCTGDGPEHCFECKSSSHNGVCVAKCPSQTYEDANGICQQCNSVCNECTGNSSVLGQSGCNSCSNETILYEYETHEAHAHCISSVNECNDSLYYISNTSQPKFCRRCHPECIGCKIGAGASNCKQCKHLIQNNTEGNPECVASCSENFYETTNGECHPLTTWMTAAVAVPVFVVLFLIIVVGLAIFVVFWRKQRRRRLEEELLIDLVPSKAKPNMSSLRLIKESELRRGNIIGSGAFGTVYKGIWIPEKENVKIPVAIKVLQDNSSNTNQNVELLDEARIMASVCHPNCVRILAVCMTAQMMLVTQLMPLGCLLDYIRKEKSNIGSRALLLWSVQIAKGMKYLEELGIVHRDLAARNVLVYNSNHVKITDFGLAKLLDHDKDEIHSDGGKMPIKWLALECIQHRIYTHKSDVWSYGVTLWEMFTYGSRPYENLQARQIPHALEKGERLPQPSICTLDVYMTLIKCWMLDAESRPTFSDLVDEFSRMAADPGRFLVIPGDTLMRLPSQAPDARDLFRMMSLPVDEPNLTIMSGEEYLRPAGLDLEDSDGFFSPTSSTCGRLMSIPEDVCYENSDATTGRRRAQSSECDAVDGQSHAKLVQQFSRERSQRYISDPCRKDDVEGGGKEDDDKLGHNSQLFRVDKDGYLPPHSVTAQPSYLELVYQPTTNQNSEPLTQTPPPPPPPPPPPQQYLDMNSSVGVSKDNLEYFDNEATRLSNGAVTNDKPGAKLNSGETKRKEEPDYCNEASAFTDLQHNPYRGLPHTDL